ncbi:Hypothetical protein SMAX5B_005226 [Scophthalmus maximus]|uniref:Uncharacterized protein n=1 Tax=Scophthalmus maximus TaxID=52904 RepID=A0A2U9BEQ1_SCOMX|nr:Hypothetical protein SMAX5B_005226 [Scophthalmus maximus]
MRSAPTGVGYCQQTQRFSPPHIASTSHSRVVVIAVVAAAVDGVKVTRPTEDEKPTIYGGGRTLRRGECIGPVGVRRFERTTAAAKWTTSITAGRFDKDEVSAPSI